MFRKTLDEGEPGDAIGLLLRGIERGDVERGQVVAEPGSITPHTEAKAQVYVLTKEEGGRHTPFFSGYKPQFYIRTTDVTGEIELPEGVEMVMPGDNIEMKVKLVKPRSDGRAAALCRQGRWQDRRLRCDHQGDRLGPRGSGRKSPNPLTNTTGRTPGKNKTCHEEAKTESLSRWAAPSAGRERTRPARTGAMTPNAWSGRSSVPGAAPTDFIGR